MKMLKNRMNIITGHYGSGKTNIAINLALQNVGQFKRTVLIDLDIVNPYFRASDNIKVLNDANIEVIAPNFANSNLDTPSLPPSIQGALADQNAMVIVDVGGDDAGAIVLGRYQGIITNQPYDFFYVINQRRPMIDNVDEAYNCLLDILQVSKLKVTAVINNTNLGEETTPEIILNSRSYAEETTKRCGVETVYTTARRDQANLLVNQIPNLLPIDLYTKKYF